MARAQVVVPVTKGEESSTASPEGACYSRPCPFSTVTFNKRAMNFIIGYYVRVYEDEWNRE